MEMERFEMFVRISSSGLEMVSDALFCTDPHASADHVHKEDRAV